MTDSPPPSALAASFIPDADRTCIGCAHVLGNHLLFGTDPVKDADTGLSLGGALICPEANCACALRWGTAELPEAFWPSDERLSALRAFVQSQSPEHKGLPTATLSIWSDDES